MMRQSSNLPSIARASSSGEDFVNSAVIKWDLSPAAEEDYVPPPIVPSMKQMSLNIPTISRAGSSDEGFVDSLVIKWDASPAAEEDYPALIPSMKQKALNIPTVAIANSFNKDCVNSVVFKWDASPAAEEDYPPAIPSMASHFRISAPTAQASLHFRRMMLMKVHLPRGTPLRRSRSCIYAIISITRLRTTLLWHQAGKRHYLCGSMQRYPSLPAFRSYGLIVVFCHRLTQKLHERHMQCSPLDTALVTISEALNFELDQAINGGKCKVLLQLFSSISSHLNIMRFVLDNLKDPLDMPACKGLSACYYTLKALCRLLSMCKRYIQDCTGFLPSPQVFANLENVHTMKFLLLDLYKCYQFLVMKFEGFVNSICDPISQEFARDCDPPSLPGSLIGHCLHIQAEKDLSQVLANLNQHPKSYWSNFMTSWRNMLNAAEDIALRDLLLARLKYPIVGNGEVEFLKKGMFVHKKHIRRVRFLGSGSFSTVEEVLCFGEKYAMKTIKGLHTVEDADEAVVQARLQHPNIVKLMWYTLDFDSQGSLSLLMDLMTTSLEDYIEQQAHSTPSRLFNYPLVSLHIMMQIARAMLYLQSQGIMHRDLKAANVLVDGTWSPDAFNEGYVHVKVADFGLAKVKQVGSQTTLLHTWRVGTGYWRAPEVFWQEPTDDRTCSSRAEDGGSCNQSPIYSFPADVYSFAMTSYEIVTGKKPFSDLIKKGMRDWVLKERIVKYHERPRLPHSLHPGLKDLIEQCWDGRPENRPSFEAICQQLDQIKDDFVFGSYLHHPLWGNRL